MSHFLISLIGEIFLRSERNGFFDEWKEKWESWSLAVKGAVIVGVFLLLVVVGGLLPKKEEVVRRNRSDSDDSAGGENGRKYDAGSGHFR